MEFFSPSSDPADGQGYSGMETRYEYWGWGGPGQVIQTLKLNDGRWYVSSSGAGDDAYDYFASVQCHQGEHFEVFDSDVPPVKVKEGCVGPGDLGNLVVLVSSSGGWTIRSPETFNKIATLIPPDPGLEYELTGSAPQSR